MADAQKIQWRRIGVESAAIVASILLAFAIDAWWDERQERLAETEIILGLEQEFLDGKVLLEQKMNEYEKMLLGVQELLVAWNDKVWSSEEMSIDIAFQTLIAPTTIDFGSGVLDAVVNAGRLEIISNRTLRADLAGWKAVLGEVIDDELRNKDHIFNQITPYLARTGVSVGHGSTEMYGEGAWPVATASIANDSALMSHLLSDTEFRSLLEIRYGFLWHTVEEYEVAIRAANDILQEISSHTGT